MGNKLCKDCFKSQSKKPAITSMNDIELKDSPKKENSLKLSPTHQRNPSRPVGLMDNSKYISVLDTEELKAYLLQMSTDMTVPIKMKFHHPLKKKLTLETTKKQSFFHKKKLSNLPIPEEHESNEEVVLTKSQKLNKKSKKSPYSSQKYTPLSKKNDEIIEDSFEAGSAMHDLRMYSFSASLDDDLLICGNNCDLDYVESLWALNQNTLYQHIDLMEYDVIRLNNDGFSFKLQNRVSLQYYELSIVEFPAENPLNLACLFSQRNILEKLSSIKFYNKFFCKLQSIYTIEASETFPYLTYSFKAIKMQESGLCSIEDLLSKGMIFTSNQILHFLKNISGLCDKSESLGIANRKLIPSNFLLNEGLTDFKIFDYSNACSILNSKTTKLKTWIKEIEAFWAPEIFDIIGSEFQSSYNPFLADVYSLGLTVLRMMGVKEDELSLLKAKEISLDKRLKNLENDGFLDVIKIVQKMLNVKPENRLTFKEIHENLKNFKSKNNVMGNSSLINELKKNDETLKNIIFYEKLGDLMYLIEGEYESINAYDQALKMISMSFIENKENIPIEIRIQEKLGKIYRFLEDYSSAIKSYIRIGDLQKSILSDEHNIENIRYLTILAQLRSEQNNFNIAIKLYSDAYNQSKAFYKGDQEKIEIAYIFKGVAEMLIRIRTFEEKGIEYSQKALDIIKKCEGVKSPLYFLFLDVLAENFDKIKALKNASDTYQLIVDEAKVVYGKVHPLLSKMYLKLSYAYYHEEEYGKAIKFYRRALRLQLKIFGEHSIEVAVTKLQLGKTYLNTHEWKKALKLLNESYEVTSRIMGDSTREVALVLNAIGLAYTIKENYEKALENYNKAYEILKEINDKDVVIYLEMGRFLEDIGALYAMQDNKTKALSYFYQGLIMRKEVYGESSPEVGLAYERIGDLNLEFNDGAAAKEAYKNALEAFEKIENHEYISIIRLLEHIGKLYIMESEAEEDNKKISDLEKIGLEYLRKCIALQDQYLTRNDEEEIYWRKAILSYIGTLHFKKMEYEESLKHMQKALELLELIYRNPTDDIAEILLNIGTIHYKSGNPEKALEYATKAYNIMLDLYGKNDNSVAKSLHILIRVYMELKDKENQDRYERILEEVKKNLNMKDDESPLKTGLIKVGKRGF